MGNRLFVLYGMVLLSMAGLCLLASGWYFVVFIVSNMDGGCGGGIYYDCE